MNRSFITGVILFISVFVSTGYAQNHYDVNQFIREGRGYYSNIQNWDAKDVIKMLVVSGAVYGIMQYDSTINIEIKKPKWFGKYGIALFGRMYGEPLTPVVLSSGLIIHGNSTGNQANKKLGFEIAQATVYSFTIVTAMKFLFGRERPAMTDSPHRFNFFSLRSDAYLSFPSGHTTIAFSISTVLSENSDTQFWKIASYVPAVITATSRMYENRHWASDVTMGAVLGYVTGKYFTKGHKEKEIVLPQQPVELISFSIPLSLR